MHHPQSILKLSEDQIGLRQSPEFLRANNTRLPQHIYSAQKIRALQLSVFWRIANLKYANRKLDLRQPSLITLKIQNLGVAR